MEYARQVLNRHGPVPGKLGRRRPLVEEVNCVYCGGGGTDPKYSSASGCPVCRGAGFVRVTPPVMGLPLVRRFWPGERRPDLPHLQRDRGGLASPAGRYLPPLPGVGGKGDFLLQCLQGARNCLKSEMENRHEIKLFSLRP